MNSQQWWLFTGAANMDARNGEPEESELDRARQWELQINRELPPLPLQPWTEPGYSAAHYAKVGLLLGAFAGCTSLIVNVIGSVLWPALSDNVQHPLRLIQVYLTLPLGEYALTLSSGLLLALGCLLYLGTGMLYGMLFEWAISFVIPNAGLWVRLAACSVLAIAVWLLNFYGILIWLQPLLWQKSWVIDLIPWWVAAITHLVFGWTMALLYPLGTRALNRRSALQPEGNIA
jgi:hypothetical protein